jgi:hypothetical protein
MRMPDYEFIRACNIARNHELGASLGIDMRVNKPRNGKNGQRNRSLGSSANQVSHNNALFPRRTSRRVINGAKETVGAELTGSPDRAQVDPLPHTDENQAETQATSTSSPGVLQRADESPAKTQTSASLRSADQSQAVNQDSLTQNSNPDQPANLVQIPPQLSQRAALVDATNSSELSQSQPPAKSKPAFTVNKTAWPGWLTEKYDYYVCLEFGDKWKECLFVWTELERAFKFISPVRYSNLFTFPFDDDVTSHILL